MSLHELGKQDKHRIVQPWGYLIDVPHSDLVVSPPSADQWIDDTVLSAGGRVFCVFPAAGLGPRDVDIQCRLTVNIAFDDPLHPGVPGLNDTLSDLVEGPASIIERMLTLVERPV